MRENAAGSSVPRVLPQNRRRHEIALVYAMAFDGDTRSQPLEHSNHVNVHDGDVCQESWGTLCTPGCEEYRTYDTILMTLDRLIEPAFIGTAFSL